MLLSRHAKSRLPVEVTGGIAARLWLPVSTIDALQCQHNVTGGIAARLWLPDVKTA